jgi:hypothetical protein
MPRAALGLLVALPICICGLACVNPSPLLAFETVAGTRKRAAGSKEVVMK